MTTNKELELKFRRIAQQLLPKGNFSNALVINSGDGLVCEYLNFLNIEKITGVESSLTLRSVAESKLPHALFLESISQLKIQKFDLIFVLDKVDFLEDEKACKIFESISKEADYIVADLFTFDSMTESAFKTFKFSATEKMSMPTTQRLVNQFPEHLARKIDQAPTHFKSIVRSIWHFRKRLPYAVILSQSSYAGKTTLAMHLFSELTHISLDSALIQIKSNKLKASDDVIKIIQSTPPSLKWGKVVYQALADNNCYIDFLKSALSSYEKLSDKGIVVDGFVPPEQVENLHRFLSKTGYYVVEIGLTNTMKPDADYSIEQVQNFYNAFYKPN